MKGSESMGYSYQTLREEAIRKGEPRYMYESTEEPLTDPSLFERLPPYFEAHVDDANARVKQILDGLERYEAFVFFADAHVRQNGMSSVPILRSILEKTGIKTVIYGGDTVSAWVNSETAREDVLYFSRAFSFAKPYMVRGNHDIYGKEFGIANDGISFSDDEVYKLIFQEGAERVCGEVGKTYYYFDHPETKTRFIVLDTNEHLTPVWSETGIWDCDVSVSEEQIEWFVRNLHAIPAGYAAVVIGHIPMFRQLKYSHPSALVLGDLIEAYNQRRVLKHIKDADFRKDTGSVLLTLAGHGHYDGSYLSSDGCVNLQIHCDAMTDNGGSRYKKTAGTVTESVLDAVILDRDTGNVFCVRYGAGIDRKFLRKEKGYEA